MSNSSQVNTSLYYFLLSLYGSRHLAAKWEKEDKLKEIDMFVLLDIIGHQNVTFMKMYKATFVSKYLLMKWAIPRANVINKF